jgi:hypothetical protein
MPLILFGLGITKLYFDLNLVDSSEYMPVSVILYVDSGSHFVINSTTSMQLTSRERGSISYIFLKINSSEIYIL